MRTLIIYRNNLFQLVFINSFTQNANKIIANQHVQFPKKYRPQGLQAQIWRP